MVLFCIIDFCNVPGFFLLFRAARLVSKHSTDDEDVNSKIMQGLAGSINKNESMSSFLTGSFGVFVPFFVTRNQQRGLVQPRDKGSIALHFLFVLAAYWSYKRQAKCLLTYL